MEELNKMDEHTQEALQQAAAVMNINVQEVVSLADEIMRAIEKAVEPIIEKFRDIVEELPDLQRSPVEIKKDIKREKNPMRLKQLNKELNESYKVYKRK